MTGHSDWKDSNVVSGVSCPAPMTRAALLTLRNAGQLRVECPYTITDHVQNRLVAGTTIVLRAVAANELSEEVGVNTTYDNEAWAGLYDLDRGVVTELHDNRGNVAKGYYGTEVANFDWGNTAITGCTVDNATWTVNYGNPSQMSRITVERLGNLNTTGFNGSMTDNHIHTVATVNFTNANGTWYYNEWKNSGTFNATGYAGGQSSYYCEYDSCSVNISGVTGSLSFRNCEFQQASIAIAGGAIVTIGSSHLQNITIKRDAGGGPLSILQGEANDSGNVTHSGAGALTVNYTEINGTINLSGTGAANISACVVENSCGFYHNGNGVMNCTRTQLRSGSLIMTDAGSTKNITVNETEIESGGAARIVGAVGGAAFDVSHSRIASASFIYVRHTGGLQVTQSVLEGASGIDAQSGDRSYTMSRIGASEIGRMTLTGTGAVTDTFANIALRVRGQFVIACSGAANLITDSRVEGLSGVLQLLGTTGGQSITRVTVENGTLQYNNCPAKQSLIMAHVSDGSLLMFNGCTVARVHQYITLLTLGRMIDNNSLGAGDVTGIEVNNDGLYKRSGQAATATHVTVSVGAVDHNGGTLTNAYKRNAGILTTGLFNHTNIEDNDVTNITLTAANANKARYLGLGNAAYAPGGKLV